MLYKFTPAQIADMTIEQQLALVDPPKEQLVFSTLEEYMSWRTTS